MHSGHLKCAQCAEFNTSYDIMNKSFYATFVSLQLLNRGLRMLCCVTYYWRTSGVLHRWHFFPSPIALKRTSPHPRLLPAWVRHNTSTANRWGSTTPLFHSLISAKGPLPSLPPKLAHRSKNSCQWLSTCIFFETTLGSTLRKCISGTRKC